MPIPVGRGGKRKKLENDMASGTGPGTKETGGDLNQL